LSAATRWVEEQMEKWAEDYENRKKVKMNKSRLRWLKAITLTVAEVNTNWIRTAAMLQGMKEHEADLSCANESALAVKRRLKGEQKEAAKRAKEIAAKIEADKKKLKAEADAAAQKSKNTHKQTKNAHKELEEKQKVAAEKRKKKQLADLEKKKAAALLKSRRWVTQQLTRLKKSDAETRAKAALALEGADLNSNIENAMKRIYKAEEAAAEKREIAAKKAGLEVEDTSDHFDIKLDKVKTLRRKKTGGEEDDEEDVFPDMEPRPSTVTPVGRRPSILDMNTVVKFETRASAVFGRNRSTSQGKKDSQSKRKKQRKEMPKTQTLTLDDDEFDEFALTSARMSVMGQRKRLSHAPRGRRLSSFAELVDFLDNDEEEEEESESEDEESQKQLEELSKNILREFKTLPKMRSNAYWKERTLAAKKASTHPEEEVAPITPDTSLAYLSNNCVITDTKLRRFRNIFDKCSKKKPGIALTSEELITALRRVNNKLIGNAEIKYIFYVLDLLGSNTSGFHDFKAFAAIAALSERVAPMEGLIKGFVDNADFTSLRQKLDRANHMFLNLFKAESAMDNKAQKALMSIPLEELEYVFRAGGLSVDKISDILRALRENDMDPLTYLDYLAYIPMFIDVHAAIIANPFNTESNNANLTL